MRLLFFLEKKNEKYGILWVCWVDRKCYIMIFSWIIPKDGFICFVSSQLLMIVEKTYHYWTWKKVLCFCDNFMNVVIRRPLFTIIWLITCHSMKSRKFLVVKIKLMLDWNLSAISVQKIIFDRTAVYVVISRIYSWLHVEKNSGSILIFFFFAFLRSFRKDPFRTSAYVISLVSVDFLDYYDDDR